MTTLFIVGNLVLIAEINEYRFVVFNLLKYGEQCSINATHEWYLPNNCTEHPKLRNQFNELRYSWTIWANHITFWNWWKYAFHQNPRWTLHLRHILWNWILIFFLFGDSDRQKPTCNADGISSPYTLLPPPSRWGFKTYLYIHEMSINDNFGSCERWWNCLNMRTHLAGSLRANWYAFWPSSVLLSMAYRPVNVAVMAAMFVSSVKNRFKIPGLAKACWTFFVPAKW